MNIPSNDPLMSRQSGELEEAEQHSDASVNTEGLVASCVPPVHRPAWQKVDDIAPATKGTRTGNRLRSDLLDNSVVVLPPTAQPAWQGQLAAPRGVSSRSPSPTPHYRLKSKHRIQQAMLRLAFWLIIVAGSMFIWGASGRSFPWSERPQSHPLPTELPQIGRIAVIGGDTLSVIDLQKGREYRVRSARLATRPRWSSDGEWLSYGQADGLWVARRNGTQAKLLDVNLTSLQATWSPRHSVLAYPTNDGALWLHDVSRAKGGKVQIAGPAARVVAPVVWSPDGQQYAWVQRKRAGKLGTDSLWIADFPRGEPQLLYTYSGPERMRLGGWTINGQHIWFWRGDVVGDQLTAQPLFTISVQGKTPFRLAASVPVRDGAVVASPLGNTVALLGARLREDSAIKPVQILDMKGAVSEISLPVKGNVASVAWSPDGLSLALAIAGYRSSDRYQVSVAGIDNMETKLLTGKTNHDGTSEMWPQWSRSGEHILTVRVVARSSGELWLMKRDGTDARLVTGGLDLPGRLTSSDFGSLVSWNRR